KQYVKPRKALKVMSRETQVGFSAAEIAWLDAKLDEHAVDPERLGVISGSNMFCPDVVELAMPCHACDDGSQAFDFGRWGTSGMREMFPLWMLKYLPNMTPCHVGISHDARGPTNSIVAGDTSGLLALIEGADTIARGHADVMLAGGVSTMLELMDLMWHGQARLSRRKSDPEQASRPFDAHRDGIIGAEAGAFLVLERRGHAEARGVSPLGFFNGYGRRSESTAAGQAPTGQAVQQAVQAALAAAGLAADELAFVAGHGMSCPRDDRMEAQALAQVIGDAPVCGMKSYYGHCGAASGALDVAMSLLALADRTIPATLNYDTPDPECPVNVAADARSTSCQTALAVSHRITGQATALAFSTHGGRPLSST
ncbi:MAG: hypothetical protein KDA61_06755, partial [Planctomycetales bacterium]|nr:hypothetical protein [Planctomycetales bacterium]